MVALLLGAAWARRRHRSKRWINDTVVLLKESSENDLHPIPIYETINEAYSDPRLNPYDNAKKLLVYDDPRSEVYDDPRSEVYDDPRSEMYDDPRSEMYDDPRQ